MKNIYKTLSKLGVLLLALTMISCVSELDQEAPNDGNQISGEEFFKDPSSYKQFLAKLYAGLAVSGQSGPAGSPDISGIDEGESQYIRGLWVMQELTTDEAIIAWNDKTIKNFHYQTWTSQDLFINATFNRLDFQVKLCNEFLRQTDDAKLNSRGVDDALKAEIKTYRAEAKFLRALSYWHFLDLFGSVGLVTEDSPSQFFLPQQASKQEIFDFVETDLLGAMGDMRVPNPGSADYPRADQAAAWMLLGKLYMNAEVYVNTNRYSDAMTYIKKVTDESGYTLAANYDELFLADNDRPAVRREVIFGVAFDGLRTKTFGGTTFLTHAPVGGTMAPAEFGINGGWGGIRTTSAFVSKFDDTGVDSRAQFHSNGQTLEIADVGNFTDGYGIKKYKNVDVNGNPGSDASGDFVDIDFPMFRLADAYLMYAECNLRGGGGDNVTALNYVNMLRQRAYGNANGAVSNINLNFILDERARELHWEGHRRTDLIRFGKFTGGSYVWPWKGKVPNGAPTAAYRNIFPIPAAALGGNPNLIQNAGY
ncbi:RagB/SusD family nutrient uptake outer membrane protein [Flavobacterium antarcticum]|uniref:RagB/SusD family nutrient uptake outer membrane protein n=1 Tax=Flavobacterium antarcticum TaxID=271155 RepID=UPI0003B456B7|nr:RagB/SusD family nutrient uptake outer membrane protein [Flavobacterium antarcticum]